MAQNLSKYYGRRRTSTFVMALCWAAASLGIAVLLIILGTLVYRGIGSLSAVVFMQDVPPPGAAGGGLRNAIVGSLILTALGTAIGTPIGLLAGTYMAEYGRSARLTSVVRFINDILLSAPSIVMGLFIYGNHGAPDGPFLRNCGRRLSCSSSNPHRRSDYREHAFAGAEPTSRSS